MKTLQNPFEVLRSSPSTIPVGGGVGWEFVLCEPSKEVACCASLMDGKAMTKPALLASHMFHFKPLIAHTQVLPTCV